MVGPLHCCPDAAMLAAVELKSWPFVSHRNRTDESESETRGAINSQKQALDWSAAPFTAAQSSEWQGAKQGTSRTEMCELYERTSWETAFGLAGLSHTRTRHLVAW